MSDDVYNNVLKIESEGMTTDRVDMSVDIYESADCVGDHEFRTETNTQQPPQCTGSDSVRIRSSRAAPVCLVLLCVLLLTAVIVLCVHIHTKSTNYTEERNELLTNKTNLTDERDQLLTNNTNLTEERDQLLTRNMQLIKERDGLSSNNQDLIKQRDQLKKEKNELLKMDGWVYYQSSLYFISSESKSWTESRRYCTERGADLIIINNREKQEFTKKMSCTNAIWIGLTDSAVEGTWKWVDGSTMTSGFWASGEPNSHKGKNEDCALAESSGWADYPCNDHFRFICEKKMFN